MGIFRSKNQKELDLALNHLNELLIKHYQDWQNTLKLSLGAHACSQLPIERVAPAFRTMWVECHKRALLMLLDSRKNYQLVSIKTPSIDFVLSAEAYEQATGEQMRRMGELMGELTRETCELNPSHRPELSNLMEEPEISKIRKEAKEQVGL